MRRYFEKKTLQRIAFIFSSPFQPDRMSSEINFASLEDCLKKHIPADELKEVKRVIFGRSDE